MTDGLMRVWRWTDNCAAQLPKLNIRNSFASLENCIGHRAQRTKGLLSDPRWSTGGDGVSHWPGRVRLQTAGQEMGAWWSCQRTLAMFHSSQRSKEDFY